MASLPYAACLTDAEGIVLFALSSDPAAKPSSLSPGCDCSEAVIGTNGAGTAIVAGQPVMIVRHEHYARAWARWTCTGAPIHAPDGSVIAAIDASTTERGGSDGRLLMVAEAARRIESEYARRLRPDKSAIQLVGAVARVFELAHVTVRELDGTIRFWNAQRLYGWSSREAAGQVSHQLLARKFPLPLDEINLKLLREGFWTGEVEDTAKNGQCFIVRSDWALLCDRTGAPIGVVETNIDITELGTGYRRLEEHNRHKDAFLSILAHEIRNPLAAIASAREVLETALGKERLQEELLALIKRQVSHLSRLADDLINLQQISKGKFDYRPEPLQLSTIIRGAVEIAQPKIDARRHQFTLAMPDDEIWLSGDRVRLIQAIANLLDNAAKYTPEGGRISLTVELEERQIVIRVCDNGIGLPSELLSSIFELYTQSVRKDSKSCAEGLGVGLALVRSIILMHGGEVEASSKGPDQGSEFVVRLPVSVAIQSG
jgi:signal transduction histidine kinase